jgi:hypothetical protein
VADHDDEEIATVVLPPEEPDCTGDEHKWTAPFDLVGGCRENPGVWGHGCGIIIHEVCSHCGVRRVTDTWAHRRDNGEQGFTEVRYERPRVER